MFQQQKKTNEKDILKAFSIFKVTLKTIVILRIFQSYFIFLLICCFFFVVKINLFYSICKNWSKQRSFI